jgi:hypothetical protein
MESTKGVFWRSSPQLLKETSDSNQKGVARLESPGPHLQFGPLLSVLENCVNSEIRRNFKVCQNLCLLAMLRLVSLVVVSSTHAVVSNHSHFLPLCFWMWGMKVPQ